MSQNRLVCSGRPVVDMLRNGVGMYFFNRLFKCFKLIILINLGLFAMVSADAFALPPRLLVDANAGGSATVGQADLLLSLKGDERRNLYLDPQAAYGTDEQWYADLGLGYRWIQNDAAILGAYLFAGRSQVERQSKFWIANPGVEAMGSRWDARINGYIPVGGRSDDLGIFRFNQSRRAIFSGHTERIVTTYLVGDETQQIGDGVDAKVGYQVFRHVPLKAYLGGYFFDISDGDNVRGGAAGLEYWFDQHVKVFANYTYDNLQHSTVVGGLALSFGGVDESRADPSLSERLTDPVERYLANLGHGSGIPSDTDITNLRTGQRGLLGSGNLSSESDSEILNLNIAFFSQGGKPNNGGLGLTLNNCTFENPCGPTDLTNQSLLTLSTILPNTELYFNGGTYNALSAVGESTAIFLRGGQSIFSRTADYSEPATGSARSTFVGGFILVDNNTISNAIILPSPTFNNIGIALIPNASNISITGTQVGNSTASARFNLGIASTVTPFNNAAVVLDNVDIFARQTGINYGGPSLLLRNSRVNVGGGTDSLIVGVRTATPNGVINMQNTEINLNSNVATIERGIEDAFLGSQITITDLTVSLNASATGAEASAFAPGDNVANATINRANINVISSAGSAYIVGGTASSAGRIAVRQAILAVNGPTASIKKAGSSANLTITSSACRVNGSSVGC